MERNLRIAVFGQKRLSREGGVKIVVKELCTRMAQQGCQVTCYNRSGHHVSGAEYDDIDNTNYEGIRQKYVPTIEKKGLAAVSASAFAALYSAFGKYDVVHIHAEGPAFFSWLPKMFGKRVVVTIHGLLGIWGKWMKYAKYIYNIQDFNPEKVLAVGYTKSKLVTDAMMPIECLPQTFSCGMMVYGGV